LNKLKSLKKKERKMARKGVNTYSKNYSRALKRANTGTGRIITKGSNRSSSRSLIPPKRNGGGCGCGK
jgi:hypothetical protein|tara:strand:+ start:303 stop:506 length:204 start_codon:yes stop_codon:yes gene_type:complete